MIHQLRNPLSVIPAKAGIHGSADRASEEWIPAFAGMTMGLGHA